MKRKAKVTSPKPSGDLPANVIPLKPKPATPAKPTRSELADQLRAELVKLWRQDLGEREWNGKNRSKMIDDINKTVGVALGEPYCISGLLVRGVKVLCEKHQLIRPVKLIAGTQNFYNNAPARYRTAKPGLAKRGDIGILRNYADKGHGHAFGFRADETKEKQLTIEYNTDLVGDRDGDGVFDFERTQKGDKSKEYRGFINVIDWILDSNETAYVADPVLPAGAKVA